MSHERRVEQLERTQRSEDASFGVAWCEGDEPAAEAEARFWRENPHHRGKVIVVRYVESDDNGGRAHASNN